LNRLGLKLPTIRSIKSKTIVKPLNQSNDNNFFLSFNTNDKIDNRIKVILGLEKNKNKWFKLNSTCIYLRLWYLNQNWISNKEEIGIIFGQELFGNVKVSENVSKNLIGFLLQNVRTYSY